MKEGLYRYRMEYLGTVLLIKTMVDVAHSHLKCIYTVYWFTPNQLFCGDCPLLGN